jgi:hypothetical protein
MGLDNICSVAVRRKRCCKNTIPEVESYGKEDEVSKEKGQIKEEEAS